MESHCYPMSKKFTNVFSNVTICTPAANFLLLCEIFQEYVKKFIMEVFQPSTLELLQSLQFFGITMSCKSWFLHQKYICHIVQWVNPCFKNVKLMVQQHCLDQSSHLGPSLELRNISWMILEVSIPWRLRNPTVGPKIIVPANTNFTRISYLAPISAVDKAFLWPWCK